MSKILKELVVKKPMERLLNIRVNEEEMKMFRKKAKEYSGGSVTAWIKFACRNYVPKKSEIVEVKN